MRAPNTRIAPSAFNGTPFDDLAAVDVLGTQSAELRNEFTSTVSSFGQSLAESLGQELNALNDVASWIRSGTQTVEQAKNRVNQILRSARGQINQLSSSLQNQLMGHLDSLGFDGLQVQVNGLLRSLGQGGQNTGNTQGIVEMLRDVLGRDNIDISVVDQAAHSSVLSTAMGEITKWQVPEVIRAVMENMDDTGIKRRTFQQSAQKVVEQSDIDSFAWIAQDQTALDALRERMPQLASQVLQRYYFPKTQSTPDYYPQRITQLVSIMDRIQPDWFYTQRGDAQVFNLAVLQGASPDGRTLLTSAEPYRTAMLTAQHYPPQSNAEILTRTYPHIPILSQTA